METPITVKFYLGESERACQEKMLTKARGILGVDEIKEERLRLTNDIEEIILKALVPEERARRHHDFDSLLIRPWPEGAGAGEVW